MQTMETRHTQAHVVLSNPSSIEDIAEEAAQYIDKNWRQFAYVDNPQCGIVSLRKIPVLKTASNRLTQNAMAAVYTLVVRKLHERGFRVVRIYSSRLKRGHVHTFKIELCRE